MLLPGLAAISGIENDTSLSSHSDPARDITCFGSRESIILRDTACPHDHVRPGLAAYNDRNTVAP